MDRPAPAIPPELWEPLHATPGTSERIAAPSLTYWEDVRRRLWADRLAMISLGFIILLILAAIFGPFFSKTYFDQDLKFANLPPMLETYSMAGADGQAQRYFLNTGNFNIYEITPGGEIAGLVRPTKKDLIKRQQIYTLGGQEVVLDSKTLPARLIGADGATLVPSGWTWNMTHWFGTDQLGRDVLARQLIGARISLAVAFVATLVNFFIGVFYGGLSGYLGGTVDNVMMRIVEIISTIPLTLYVILMMVLLQSGLLSIILAIGTVFWVDMARIVRGQILTLKQQDYVAAARTMGASTGRILTRHLLPNAMGPILVTLTMLIPSAIFIESFMSFIGLGVTPPLASWGTLTSEAVETMRAYPHQLFFPAAAISVTMFAFNFLGDGLRDALDPRGRK